MTTNVPKSSGHFLSCYVTYLPKILNTVTPGLHFLHTLNTLFWNVQENYKTHEYTLSGSTWIAAGLGVSHFLLCVTRYLVCFSSQVTVLGSPRRSWLHCICTQDTHREGHYAVCFLLFMQAGTPALGTIVPPTSLSEWVFSSQVNLLGITVKDSSRGLSPGWF